MIGFSLVCGGILFSMISLYYIEKRRILRKIKTRQKKMTFESLLLYVKDQLYKETGAYKAYKEYDREYEKARNRCRHLQKALKQCSYGYKEDKIYVTEIMKGIIRQILKNDGQINDVIPYNYPDILAIEDIFDIILFKYEKDYGERGLSELFNKYELDREKRLIERGKTPSYIVTEDEIKDIFYLEDIYLSYDDKVLLLAQKIYSYYKGYGVVDRIRDMAIDGVSGGVSGKVDDNISNEFVKKLEEKDQDLDGENLIGNREEAAFKFYDSVWVIYRGKPVHLSFLSFKSEKELRRVCQNIYRFNKVGQLSENVGYKVNEMIDGSRVVVTRPPFSETWAFFVRKFHIKKLDLQELFKGENSYYLITFIKYMVKGARISAITGAQNTGKTTLLMAMVAHIYATLTLRIQELAFELHLREVYPMRNILSFKETEFVSGQEGLDLQKKTDGAVNILGEVATDEVSALMLQVAQVASLFTLFTHHAKTTEDLIQALRNSLLKCDVFSDERIAKEQVADVINFDIHLNKNYRGKRYIERITEIVRVEGEEIYSLREIISYQDGGYILKNLPSDKTMEEMKVNMIDEDAKDFSKFCMDFRSKIG